MTFTEVRTDPLTGVNNRRGMDDSLGSQLALLNRYGTAALRLPCSISTISSR